MRNYTEINFDGLIGPTHNYAGLALGNVAAATNAGAVSNPRAAALQGIAKMRALMKLGCLQGVLPPPRRPHLPILRALGFSGDDATLVESAASRAPDLLANVYSASSMWAANAATVAPSPDTRDGRVHFTPANLASNFHRSIEVIYTAKVLRKAFPPGENFIHHDPLPLGVHFGDEGAANHSRLVNEYGTPGIHLFVYGLNGRKFPSRQQRRASEAIARLHELPPERVLFLQQSAAAIDAGVFHNDVACVADRNVMLVHEMAFENQPAALDAIRRVAPFVEIIEVKARELSVNEAVSTYLFNSQIVTLPDGEAVLIAPVEAGDSPRARTIVESHTGANRAIRRAVFLDVRESMRNGGGPACLRLRVVLSDAERAAVNPLFLLSDNRLELLESFVRTRYRDRVTSADLSDPTFMVECFEIYDDLENCFFK